MPFPSHLKFPFARIFTEILLWGGLVSSIACYSPPLPLPIRTETDPEPEWLSRAKRGRPGFLLGVGESTVSERLSLDAAMADLNRKVAQIVGGWTTSRDILVTTQDRQHILSFVIVDASQATTTPWHQIQNQVCLRTRTKSRPSTLVGYSTYVLVEIDETALRLAIRKHQDRMQELNRKIEAALSKAESAGARGDFQEASNSLGSTVSLLQDQPIYARQEQALRTLGGLRQLFSDCNLSVTRQWNPAQCKYSFHILATNGKGKPLRGLPVCLDGAPGANFGIQTTMTDSNGKCTFEARPRLENEDEIRILANYSSLVHPFMVLLQGDQSLSSFLVELSSATQPVRMKLTDHSQGPPSVDLSLRVQWRRPGGWMLGTSAYIETIHGKVKVGAPSPWAGTVRVFHMGYRDANSEQAQLFAPRGMVFSWTFSKEVFAARDFSLSDTAEAVARAAQGIFSTPRLEAVFEIRISRMCDGAETTQEMAIALPEVPR